MQNFSPAYIKGWTYVWTIFSESKFLGCMDYQIFLPMVLRCVMRSDFFFHFSYGYLIISYRYGRLLNINRTLPYRSLILFNCFLKKLFSCINEIRLFKITFLVLLKKFCLECSRMATRLLYHMQFFYAWRQG